MLPARWDCGFFTGSRVCSALAEVERGFAEFTLTGAKGHGKDDCIRGSFSGNLIGLFYAGQSLSHGYAGIGLLVLVQEIATSHDLDYLIEPVLD